MAMSGFGKALGYGVGGSLIGSGLFNLFGDSENPADSAMPYLDQIKDSISKYYDPWISQGLDVVGHPEMAGQDINKIGGEYHQSPGFKFALQQALQGSNHAAAAGGMAGSPQHEQQNMGLATNLANQDYYNWLKPALGMYQQRGGWGLEGSKSMADQIAQALAQKAAYSYQGQAAQNQSEGSGFGNILGGLGAIASIASFL